VKAGIIGGTGKMGRLFAGVFSRAGYDVLVSGRSTELSNTALAGQCDIVMVSVPIRETVHVIDEIAPILSKDQLLCDLTSLKVAPVEAMKRSNAEVIGMHPMFGPTVTSLLRQTIVICPERCRETTLHTLLTILRAEGAECTITTPEAHDRAMAVVQGLTHFVTLCMAESVRRLGTDIEKTRQFMSPVYQIEMGLAGRLLSQDPDLYGSILQENPFMAEVLAACSGSVDDLQEIVASGDPARFREFFARNARHFGDYCAEGMERTDKLIEYLVHQ
jgi:prephenate dehydrogenase